MAISNKTNTTEAQQRLEEWLRTKIPAAEEIQVLDVRIPRESGLSNETILFEVYWFENERKRNKKLVARVQPTGPAVHPHYDVSAEFRLLEILKRTNIPVANPLWFESDRSILGAPFIVTEQVSGRVPADDPPYTTAGWFLELAHDRRTQAIENGLAALAAIHALDVERLELGHLRKARLDDEMRYLKSAYRWSSEGQSNPTIELAFERLANCQPASQSEFVLNWGDARIGNMLFADDLSVSAVLDWELAMLASPEMDLGWWLFLQRHHTEGLGVPLPRGIPDHAETIRRYEAISGRRVRDIEFYEQFAALRGAIQMHRTGKLMIQAGFAPMDSTIQLCNPANIILAKLLNLPAPQGIAQSWVGNRS